MSVFILEAINPVLKGHMINIILHLWSFYMKFMKLAVDPLFSRWIWNYKASQLWAEWQTEHVYQGSR